MRARDSGGGRGGSCPPLQMTSEDKALLRASKLPEHAFWKLRRDAATIRGRADTHCAKQGERLARASRRNYLQRDSVPLRRRRADMIATLGDPLDIVEFRLWRIIVALTSVASTLNQRMIPTKRVLNGESVALAAVFIWQCRRSFEPQSLTW